MDIYSFFPAYLSQEVRNPIEYLKEGTGNSLAAHCLRLLPSNAGGMSSIPGQGMKIPHASGCSQKLKKKKKTFFGEGTCNMGKSFYTIYGRAERHPRDRGSAVISNSKSHKHPETGGSKERAV